MDLLPFLWFLPSLLPPQDPGVCSSFWDILFVFLPYPLLSYCQFLLLVSMCSSRTSLPFHFHSRFLLCSTFLSFRAFFLVYNLTSLKSSPHTIPPGTASPLDGKLHESKVYARHCSRCIPSPVTPSAISLVLSIC